MRMYVAECKGQQEELAISQLTRQGFDCLCPSYIKTTITKGVISRTIRPLFPRYIMVSFDINSVRWQAICNTRGVKRLLFDEEPTPLPIPVADDLLERFRHPLEDKGTAVEDNLRLLIKGESVRINRGAYEGFEAVITGARERKVNFVLLMFGRPVHMEMQRRHVTPLEKHEAA